MSTDTLDTTPAGLVSTHHERSRSHAVQPPTPLTRYARSGRHHIAYQVIGDGPIDILVVPGFVSNLELHWQLPGFASFYERLGRLGRLIVFDKLGTGLSDRVAFEEIPTASERADDLMAVLDAAGSVRAILIGISEGAPMALAFAAHHPTRVEQVIAIGGFDNGAVTWPGELDRNPEIVGAEWGRGHVFAALAPSWADDAAMVAMLGRYERHAASPAVAARLTSLLGHLDIRSVLAHVPHHTTIIHRRGDTVFSVERARQMALALPSATLIELEGSDHLVYAGDVDAVLDAVESCVTGNDSPHSPADRELAALVFVDIVGSTRGVRRLGDRAWTDVLHRFYASAETWVTLGGGRVVKTIGDGFFAAFGSPEAAIRSTGSVRKASAELGLTIRAGVHAAEIERVGDDLVGIGVHLTARVSHAAADDEIWVSRTVRDLVMGSGLRFDDRGSHCLAGLEGRWELWAVAR